MNHDELIRRLCIRAVNAEDDELEAATRELHMALKHHIRSLRDLASSTLVGISQRHYDSGGFSSALPRWEPDRQSSSGD